MNPNLQPDRPPKTTHLKPLETLDSKVVSDREILRRFHQAYQQTGHCDSISGLVAVAKLAYEGKLITPEKAQASLESLQRIESELLSIIVDLHLKVKTLKPTLAPEEHFGFLQGLTKVNEHLERLIAIAHQHPDPDEPGSEEGIASCYLSSLKRVNDLRYGLAYLQETLSSQRLRETLTYQPHLTITQLEDILNDLYCTASNLIFQLRENIASQVPQF